MVIGRPVGPTQKQTSLFKISYSVFGIHREYRITNKEYGMLRELLDTPYGARRLWQELNRCKCEFTPAGQSLRGP